MPQCSSTPVSKSVSVAILQSDDEVDNTCSVTPTKKHLQLNNNAPILSPLKNKPADISNDTIRPINQLSLPLTASEEKLFTHIAKLKLKASKNKRLIHCKSKSHPIALWKFIQPRQHSKLARTPLRKKRATEVRKFRTAMSGDSVEDKIRQQSSELKTEKKKVARNILDSAGLGKQIITAKEMVRLQGKLGISNTAQRVLRSVFRKKGIKVPSELEERQFKNDALCSQVKVNKRKVFIYGDNKPVKKDIPVAEVENIPEFVTNCIDKLHEKNLLTWHAGAIPDDEVWVKVGGDHGRDSFKLCLQILNVNNPNAKGCTSIICIAECKDSMENLQLLLSQHNPQIQTLSGMQWQNKTIRVFQFGDYEYLTKMYGLSGAAGVHPCLWCNATKKEIQKHKQDRIGTTTQRTLHGIKKDNTRFVKAGAKKENVKAYNNALQTPIWDIQLTQTAPPYLHLLLGIVKKHQDLLENDCHRLDMEIALNLKTDIDLKNHNTTSYFRSYVRSLEEEIKLREKMQHFLVEGTIQNMHLGSGLDVHNLFDDAPSQIRDHEDIEMDIEDIEKEIEACKADPSKPALKFRFGPVARTLSEVLYIHNIVAQAFHSHSYIGNHCHKYLKPQVYSAVCDSVVERTIELTDSVRLHDEARMIRNKYLTLNQLFSRVHYNISHGRPIRDVYLPEIEESISEYMTFFRTKFTEASITPKQHILEEHCVDWIARWGFGMAFHGEQGGEQIHHTMEHLKRRYNCVRNINQRLELSMKEQNAHSSPAMAPTPPKQKKKNYELNQNNISRCILVFLM